MSTLTSKISRRLSTVVADGDDGAPVPTSSTPTKGFQEFREKVRLSSNYPSPPLKVNCILGQGAPPFRCRCFKHRAYRKASQCNSSILTLDSRTVSST